MSSSSEMPQAGKDGTELGWTDRRSFKVLSYDENIKQGTAAFYKDCYDVQTPLGTELGEPFYFKFAYRKWRKATICLNGERSFVEWNVIFGVRNGYYDLSF